MSALKRVAIFGGTFDPVHSGHLNSATELVEKLDLDSLSFMPCFRHPEGKQPMATVEQRIAMLSIVIASYSKLHLDLREVRTEGISYTVNSLARIREELGSQAVICFVLGSDAFHGLHRWHRWKMLFGYANLVVIQRAGELPAAQTGVVELQNLLSKERVDKVESLPTHGKLLVVSLNPYPVASSEIRRIIHNRGLYALPEEALPLDIRNYVEALNLYSG